MISRFDVKFRAVTLKHWPSEFSEFLDNAGSKMLKEYKEFFFLFLVLLFGSSWCVFSCVFSFSILVSNILYNTAVTAAVTYL